MSGGWAGSERRDELPENWSALRRAQLEADGFRCVWRLPSGARCPNVATDVDHHGGKWDHKKLRSLCGTHHDKRTSRQGNGAKAKRQALPPRKSARPW